MRQTTLLLLLFICCHTASAQTNTHKPDRKITPDRKTKIAMPDTLSPPALPLAKTPSVPIVYKIVEQMPAFPGDLNGFLSQNLRYPDSASKYNIQGRVIVRFIVRGDGSIDSTGVVSGVNEYLDAEALRVVRTMPNWKPARMQGKPVDVYFTLPITFKLD